VNTTCSEFCREISILSLFVISVLLFRFLDNSLQMLSFHFHPYRVCVYIHAILITEGRFHLSPRYKSHSSLVYVYRIIVKGKGKVVLRFNSAPRHEGILGEWRYSSTHSLTSALGEGEWSASRPAALPPGKGPLVPIA
jgi:hypothetical protein